MKRAVVVGIFLFGITSLFSIDIIFDVHGVLVDFAPGKELKKMIADDPDLDASVLKEVGNPIILLNDLFTQHCPLCPTAECRYMLELEGKAFVPEYKGVPLAHVLAEWKKGHVGHDKMLEYTELLISSVDPEQVAIKHLKVLSYVGLCLFDLTTCKACHVRNETGALVLEKLKKVDDAKGHRLFLFTNAYPAWLEEHADFLNSFSGTMYGPSEGKIKPDKIFFEQFVRTYELDPTNCLLLDDKIANVLIARELGMQAMVFDPSRYVDIMRKLVELDVLDQTQAYTVNLMDADRCRLERLRMI